MESQQRVQRKRGKKDEFPTGEQVKLMQHMVYEFFKKNPKLPMTSKKMPKEALEQAFFGVEEGAINQLWMNVRNHIADLYRRRKAKELTKERLAKCKTLEEYVKELEDQFKQMVVEKAEAVSTMEKMIEEKSKALEDKQAETSELTKSLVNVVRQRDVEKEEKQSSVQLIEQLRVKKERLQKQRDDETERLRLELDALRLQYQRDLDLLQTYRLSTKVDECIKEYFTSRKSDEFRMDRARGYIVERFKSRELSERRSTGAFFSNTSKVDNLVKNWAKVRNGVVHEERIGEQMNTEDHHRYWQACEAVLSVLRSLDNNGNLYCDFISVPYAMHEGVDLSFTKNYQPRPLRFGNSYRLY